MQRVPDQGGTRKVVALARSVANLLTNFTGYCAGMHARLAQSQGNKRKGSQRVGNLVTAGRRLTSMDFVTLTLALQEFLKEELVPICLISETNTMEAIEVWRSVQDALVSFGKASLLLTEIRRWLFVTVLVGQYTSKLDLMNLWCALRYTKARMKFPGVTRNMTRLLLSQTYSGCKLTYDPGPDA